MPWWVPSFDNGALGALLGFACAMTGWIVKTLLPSWRDQATAKAAKIEQDSKLSESVRMNHERLCDMHERSIEMQSANTNAIAVMAAIAGTTDKRIAEVYRHLLSGCKCENQQEGKS